MGTGALGVSHKPNALVGDEVSQVVEMIRVVVFDALSVVVHAVVVKPTVSYQPQPFRPTRRNVRAGVLIQVLAEVTCGENNCR